MEDLKEVGKVYKYTHKDKHAYYLLTFYIGRDYHITNLTTNHTELCIMSLFTVLVDKGVMVELEEPIDWNMVHNVPKGKLAVFTGWGGISI